MKSSIEYWTKTFPEKQRQAREADLPRRLAVLTPSAVAKWIGVIDEALPGVARVKTDRPCDYSAWAAALGAPRGPNAEKQNASRYYYYGNGGLADEFMSFATDASQPDWPDDHAHLVEFALRFLEADVMLFRSGYTKRHLLRRLRQAKLDQGHKARCIALIKRAVTDGTGLEEFREFTRLAVQVGDDALKARLTEMANGAFLTTDDFRGMDYFDVFGRLHDAGKYSYAGWFQSPCDPRKLDVSSLDVVHNDPPNENRTKRNAWRILYHLHVIERQSPDGLPLS